MKRIIFSVIGILLVLLIIAYMGFYRYNHSTINKTLNLDHANLAIVNFAKGKIAILNNEKELKVVYLKKGVLGWKKALDPAPILKNTQAYNQLVSFFNIDGQAFVFGFFPSQNIKSVIFNDRSYLSGSLEISYEVGQEGSWFIPLNKNITTLSSENLIVIMNDGTRVSYPFSELR
ncbi:hypothetical protein AWM70_12785 [Paenibacillus yonginensis]|uniref:Uncharacterized protein n=1 Tax=Paenibacillus yonginensis TaxID=1462996 RepID=A0A1B1N1T5_9BACL|nr:hypothetical protein [Paenibacillus yonginensis]ANS75375.1 hypothetical protein AWM70_12785 [Paenibacillus yonginensis]